ncbi:hypothetical protein A2897_01235, partial [Candidatus Woesebacteria bacterium RIFCSPLOWO2_01_FULL_44_24b]
MNSILRTRLESLFAQTVSDLKTPEEAREFINDFFFPSEKESFVKRLALIYWLKKGRGYSNIKQNLKVSSATIASAQTLLDKKGVQNALKKIEAEEWANQ